MMLPTLPKMASRTCSSSWKILMRQHQVDQYFRGSEHVRQTHRCEVLEFIEETKKSLRPSSATSARLNPASPIRTSNAPVPPNPPDLSFGQIDHKNLPSSAPPQISAATGQDAA
jgi:hypothetical protein